MFQCKEEETGFKNNVTSYYYIFSCSYNNTICRNLRETVIKVKISCTRFHQIITHLKEKEVFGLNLTDFQYPPLVGEFPIDLDTWKSYQNLGLSLRGVTCNTSMAGYI